MKRTKRHSFSAIPLPVSRSIWTLCLWKYFCREPELVGLWRKASPAITVDSFPPRPNVALPRSSRPLVCFEQGVQRSNQDFTPKTWQWTLCLIARCNTDLLPQRTLNGSNGVQQAITAIHTCATRSKRYLFQYLKCSVLCLQYVSV